MSVPVKRAKQIVRFIIAFFMSIFVLASCWMFVGCGKHDLELDKCGEESWIYIAMRTHEVRDKTEVFLCKCNSLLAP